VPHIRRPVAPPVAFEPEVPETDDLGEGLPPRRPVRRPRRPRSRLCRWTINLFKALFTLATLAVLGVAGWVAWVTRDLPSVATLRAYEPSEVTHVYASDGTLLGEIYEERRYVLPLNKIPQHVQDAFIAAEDARFWEHSGIDAEGILRALGRNVAAGRVAQGGSTITQQIAKVFLLNSDRALSRKVREALLSWRIERTYTKEHILYLYLNEIFLGSQSYGVEAASRTFFGKHVQEITLAEAAILAGLPPRPSAYNPRADFEAALERQRYVLGQMVKNEFVTQEEANAALAQPIQLATEDNLFLEQAPIFTEYARRYLVEHYGEDRAKRGGLTVFTTVDMGLQRKAEKAIADRVGRWDENFGVRREDIEHLDDDAAIETWRKTKQKALVQRWYDTHDPSKRQSPKPDEALVAMGEQVEAVVLDVKSGTLRAAVGDLEFTIPIKWADFAYPAKGTQIFSRQTSRANFTTQVDDDDDGKYDGTLFRRGDIIQAEIATLPAAATPNGTASGTKKAPPSTSATAKLRQKAGLHAALYSLDLPTGAVRVMVGGADDFRLSQLNRAVQAYRQVGSTFKPLVYAAALQSRMLSVSSNVPDAPIVIRNPKTHTVYRPGNYAGGFSGDTNMVMALAKSRNLSAVWTYQHIDPYADTDLVYNFVRGLGVGGPPLHHMPANVGERPETNHLCRWVDAKNPDAVACQTPLVPGKGQTAHGAAPTGQACRMCDITVGLGSASLTPAEMTTAYATFANGGIYLDPYIIEEVRDRNGNVLEKHRPEPPYQVMAPEVATIMTWLLQKVVTQGTARLASSLGVDVAGKTGTTNDWRDAWFIGYTPDVVTTVWVGFDQPRTMAQSATGGHTALPLWVDYMKNVADRSRGRSFPVWGNVVWEGNMPYINGVMPNIDPLELLYPGEAPKPKEPVQRIITAPAVPEISEVGTDL
jgi:penicillin-binding protein 1A